VIGYLGTTATVEFKPVTCSIPGCGLIFAFTVEFIQARKNDHKNWYCPNGHVLHWSGESDLERTQRERDAARLIAVHERESRRRAEARERTAEYRRRAAAGQLTKTRKRIANGVCPCCHRSFPDLHTHMSSQHPGYSAVTSDD
jgi:hypothetical protein